MKVLLDEDLPHRLRLVVIPSHAVFTVAFMKWGGVKNGRLLSLTGDAGFDVLVTADRGYEYQQNLLALPCAVLLLRFANPRDNDVARLAVPVLRALRSVRPKSFFKVTV